MRRRRRRPSRGKGDTSPASAHRLVARDNVDLLDDPLRLRPDEIDREQPVHQIGAEHLHAVGKKKGALELAGGDAAMEEMPLAVLYLPAPDDELIFLERDIELVAGEAGDRQGDAQPLRFALRTRQALDIVGRVAVRAAPGHAVERALDFVEAEQERRIERGTRHVLKPFWRLFTGGTRLAS